MKTSLRITSVLLALLMTAGLLAACSPGDASTTPPSTNPQTGTATTTEPEGNASRAKVNIRFAQFGNSIDDPDGMKNDPIKKAIEEAVNVTLEYDTGTDGFDDRMQTELATGGAPDLFPTWGESEKITSWIEQDVLVNLGEIVAADPERYPTLAKMFSDPAYKSYNKLYSGDENAVYAIYSIAALPSPSFAGVPVYNTKILNEAFGDKAPATVEEFIQYAKAAGDKGYAGWWPRNDKLTRWTEIDATLAQPQGTTIVAPRGDVWEGFTMSGTLGKDEKWTLATVSDKSKEVVKQLSDLYKANGLHQGVGVRGDFDDAYAEFGAGAIGAVNFGFGYPNQFRDFYNSGWAAANPSAQMSDLTLGNALTSGGNYGKVYTTGMWMGAHYFIPYTCENPERVLDLVEYLASNEGQSLLFKGIEGQQYTGSADPHTYDVAAWANVNKAYGYPDPDRARYVWFGYLFSATEFRVDLESKGWWDAVTEPYDNTNDWANDSDKALVSYAQGVIDQFVDQVVVKLPSYYALITLPAEANDIRTKMQDITNRYLTQMIGGQMDIDKEWANYVAEYEAAGSARLEELLNTAVANARSGNVG